MFNYDKKMGFVKRSILIKNSLHERGLFDRSWYIKAENERMTTYGYNNIRRSIYNED